MNYQCDSCKTYYAIKSDKPELNIPCGKCGKATKHVLQTGTMPAAKVPQRAFISSFLEPAINPAPKTVEVKPAAPNVTKLDVKAGTLVNK